MVKSHLLLSKNFYSYEEYKKNLEDETYTSKDIEIFNNKDSKFEITGDRNINTNEFFLLKKKVILLHLQKTMIVNPI